MPSCQRCGADPPVEDLVRHSHDRILIVHCPDCGSVLGQYRRHGDQTPTVSTDH